MKNLLRILNKYHLFLLFLLLQSLAFGLLFNYNTYHKSSYINASTAITGDIFAKAQQVKDYLILAKSNEQLATENAQIKNTLLSAYKSNRVSYQEIYDSIYELQWRFMDCKLAYNSISKQNNILIIDKGSKHGITPEMAIVSSRGVVGIVRNVAKNYSAVLSLLNTNVAISAKLKNSGHFGTLRWDGRNIQYCYLSDIPNHVKIDNGDTIVTSGYSTIFPEGIMIGVAADVNKSEDLNFFQIKVRLSEDFGSLTHVYAVKNMFKHELDSIKRMTGND
jgi:rod shape-determining protein MreC